MSLQKLADNRAIQYAGCYSLDLYCDTVNPLDHPHHNEMRTFTGNTFAECARDARKRGWKIDLMSRTATCPKCVRALSAGDRK